MSRLRQGNKEAKKPPATTAKERRNAKRIKKQTTETPQPFLPPR